MYFLSIDRSGVDDDYAYGRQGGFGPLDVEVPQGRPVEAFNDPLDDVFGSASGPSSEAQAAETDAHHHPSDMHRLQTEHTTAGYREGITAAKESTIQAGFDEGFSLGATIGLSVGQLLGTLEGIEEALRNKEAAAAEGTVEQGKMIERLLAEAREELSSKRIFAADFWAPDGNWTYAVDPRPGNDEVLFSDVAGSHPLIKKWSGVVEEQLAIWGISSAVMGGEAEESRALALPSEPTMPSSIPSPAPTPSKKGLDW